MVKGTQQLSVFLERDEPLARYVLTQLSVLFGLEITWAKKITEEVDLYYGQECPEGNGPLFVWKCSKAQEELVPGDVISKEILAAIYEPKAEMLKRAATGLTHDAQ